MPSPFSSQFLTDCFQCGGIGWTGPTACEVRRNRIPLLPVVLTPSTSLGLIYMHGIECILFSVSIGRSVVALHLKEIHVIPGLILFGAMTQM
jgi:hypothetical protein